MIADIAASFGFTLSEIDEFQWSDILLWHTQHQRVREDHIQLTQISSQMAAMSTMGQAFGGTGS